MIPDYPKIYTIGHKCILDIFKEPVIVEEKVDGSQFSFMKEKGDIKFRSKGQAIYPEYPQKLFKKAVDSVLELSDFLTEGYIYRAEAVCAPKHNTICYARAPERGFILFDVERPLQNFLNRAEKEAEAKRLGIEVVPVLFDGNIQCLEDIEKLLDTESCLGGAKIEGFVAKNYERMTVEGKIMIGKFVSEAFKEQNGMAWKNSNPGKKDIIESLVEVYRHTNRWLKSIQHFKEAGLLTETPKDIGPLIGAIQDDVKKECEDEIRDSLFKWAWKQIAGRLVKGFPEFYKEYLAKQSFV